MTTTELGHEWLEELVHLIGGATPATDPDAGLARIAALDRLTNAAAAAIARQSVAFAEARSAQQSCQDVPRARLGQGVVGELALARGQSPHRAGRQLGWARILVAELPETLETLASGRTTEWRAMLVARETGWLSAAHRAEIDRTIAPELPELGDRKVENRARALAAQLDPEGKVRRLAMAESERCVSLRPAPDAMTWLTAALPVKQGVAVYAALRAAADTGAADGRSRGQVMADTLVERVTGQRTADGVPLAVNVIMPVEVLLDAGDARAAPATVDGYGAVPAAVARDLVRRSEAAGDRDGEPVPLWIRRLYTAPDTGALVAMDSRSRFFSTAQREFVRLRDQICRTPYCGAPIRHTDHVEPAADGGPTALTNAQGLCEACNHTKQAPGWKSRTEPDGTVVITTPGGCTYYSRPPSLAPPSEQSAVMPVPCGSPRLGSSVTSAAAPPGAR